MIRFRFSGNRRHPEPIAFIGLSHNNLDALKRGRPIRILAHDKMGLNLNVELVIFAGSTEVDMTQELEDHGFVPKGSTDKTAKAIRAKREFRLQTEPNGDG